MGNFRSKPQYKGHLYIVDPRHKILSTIMKYCDIEYIGPKKDRQMAYKNYKLISLTKLQGLAKESDIVMTYFEMFNDEDRDYWFEFITKSLLGNSSNNRTAELNPRVFIIILRTKYYEENRENILKFINSNKYLANYRFQIGETDIYQENRDVSLQEQEIDFNCIKQTCIIKL